jgi:hypothetical protein
MLVGLCVKTVERKVVVLAHLTGVASLLQGPS